MVLDWPEKEVLIKSLGSQEQKIKSIDLLGSQEVINWKQSETTLIIQPSKSKIGDFAFVYKIEFFK
ncbi:hypothetical protein M601_009240 [Cellulophaga baltica 4]|nr:hypothetical protein M601_009240 [Cellulophaga baltica 4]